MNTQEYEIARAVSVCQVCGITYKDHPKCAICGILAGPQHIETELQQMGDKLVCASCKEWREIIRA